MGDDLHQEEWNSVRTPMQWNAQPNAGFADPSVKKLRRPVIDSGEFDYRQVNVQAQRRDPHSLLNSLERMIRTRKEYPEFGCGKWRLVEAIARIKYSPMLVKTREMRCWRFIICQASHCK